MATKKRSYTPFMAHQKHHKRGYFADLGRKGGNQTKKRHQRSGFYAKIGRAGGQATVRRRGH